MDMVAPLDLFDGEVPNRDWVLDQGFWFDPVDRIRRLPSEAMWPAELDKCPQDGRRRFVDRRCVFRIAERVVDTAEDELGAVQLLVAAIIWGTGTGARNAGFRLEGLHQDHDAPRKLTRVLQVVRTAGAKSAFNTVKVFVL